MSNAKVPQSFDDDEPPSTRQVEDLLYPQRKALATLMHSDALSRGDVKAAFELVTEVASKVLRVERASVWRFRDDKSALECADLFERTPQLHARGASLSAASFPGYFAALAEERSIPATDAHTDPRTREFSRSYLTPHGIGAMLDAPVMVRGSMVGVVCHEHVGGARKWLDWETIAAGSMADFVALALEAAESKAAHQALAQQHQRLEALVAERTLELTGANESLKREVAERSRIEERLRQSEKNLKTMFEISPIVLVLSSVATQRVIMANQRTSELFDIPMDRVIGQKTPDYYVDPADRARMLAHVTKEGHVDNFETVLKTLKGKHFHALLSAQLLEHEGEQALLVSAMDVSVQKETEAKLRDLATTDSLTGCFNRRHFLDLATVELDRSNRYGRPLSMAMIDADHFKDINDRFGHDAGDEVLRAIADSARATLRKSDLLARFGGEEFVVLFVETALDSAVSVAERLLVAVSELGISRKGTKVPVAVSIGLAEIKEHEPLEALLKRADDALYRAKDAGRNRVVASR